MKGACGQSGDTLLEWNDLAYSIPFKSSPTGRKDVLYAQSGQAIPGEILAIMGPSGGGKTSLLNSLAGRLPVSKGALHTGVVNVNGVPRAELPCPFADISAYVEQEEALFALSTVQETLDFCARLRLPSSTPPEERAARIEHVLRQLGLVKVRHTNVGGTSFNGSLRGLSGGERKRLSIGVELLHKPKCIFLDEPTTGLDSYQALNIISHMQELANDQHTIVISIHQPRSAIYAMFNRIYLVSAGKPVFEGDINAANEYFETIGFPLPPKFSPADFFIDLLSIDQRDEEQQSLTEARLDNLHKSWANSPKKSDSSPMYAEALADRRKSILQARVQKPAGQHAIAMPFYFLLVRAWREQMRDKAAIVLKIFFNSVFSAIFGLVYWQLDRDQKSIQDRTGLLFFLTMNQAFGATIGTAQVIPRQIAVVQRERANRLYAILPYYISNLVVTLPIELLPVLANASVVYFMADLGGSFLFFFIILALENLGGISLGMALSACFKNVTMAPQLAPAAVILFLIFNGFLINEDSIPVYFIWLREISFIRYAFKAAIVNEFEDVAFSCGDISPDVPCITNGDIFLKQLGFDPDNMLATCTVFSGWDCGRLKLASICYSGFSTTSFPCFGREWQG